MDLDLLQQVACALGVGVLIGLERSTDEGAPGPAAAAPVELGPPLAAASGAEAPRATAPATGDSLGARTFALLALIGWALAFAGERHVVLLPVGLAVVGALVIAMYWRTPENGPGITTEAAAIGTCVLGAVCRIEPSAAVVCGVVVAIVLASKRFTYGVVRSMRRVELTDTLKLLVVAGIVLPVLPNRALDPYGAMNPHKIGLMVVLISGIGFAGYFLTRILGARRGLGLMGVIGGLTSSTAVTASMAARARSHPGLTAICAVATVAANATMFIRVLVVVAVISAEVALRLAWSIGAMALVAGIATAALWFSAGKTKDPADEGQSVRLENPFSLGPALKFGAFFVFILFAAKLAKLYLGDRGLFAAAGLSGLADVDAITLTLSEQAHAGGVAIGTATLGIIIAVVSNSVVKSTIALVTGGWRFGSLVAMCLGLATGTGLLVAVLL